MVGKRFFLIAGGTVGGLGVVLSITPPQFGSTTGLTLGGGTSLSGGTTLPGGTTTGTTPSAPISLPTTKPAIPGGGGDEGAGPIQTPKPLPKPVTPKATRKATPKATPPGTTGGTTPVTPPQGSGVSGTFTGGAAGTIYGPVQVQITLVGGKITNAVALTYPTGSFRDQQINQQAIPYLIQETLAAQSANIQGVGGASYTSQGWATSLQSALNKAGL